MNKGCEFYSTFTCSGCQRKPSGCWNWAGKYPCSRALEDKWGYCPCSITMLSSWSSPHKSKAFLTLSGGTEWGDKPMIWHWKPSPLIPGDIPMSFLQNIRDPQSSVWIIVHGANYLEGWLKGKSVLLSLKNCNLVSEANCKLRTVR